MLQLVPGKTRPNLIDPAQRRVIPDLDFARAERVIVLQESRKFTFNSGPMLTLDQRHESLSDDSRIGVFAQIRKKTIRLAPCGQNPQSLGPTSKAPLRASYASWTCPSVTRHSTERPGVSTIAGC